MISTLREEIEDILSNVYGTMAEQMDYDVNMIMKAFEKLIDEKMKKMGNKMQADTFDHGYWDALKELKEELTK